MPEDLSIGERIKARRQTRGWSIRFLASRAGTSTSMLSRVERGLRSADNRFLVADLAAALECSVQDLTGQPYASIDRDLQAAQVGMHHLRAALMECDLDEPSVLADARPLDELAENVHHVRRLHDRCDYAGVGRILPALLRELHAHAGQPEALRLLVLAAEHAGNTSRNLGNFSDSWLAAERARQAAETLNEPVSLARAAFARAHAAIGVGLYPRAQRIAERAATELERDLSASTSLELLGMLQLTCGFTAYGQHIDGREWIDDAEKIAERTGHTDVMWFGPTNVRFWRVAIETDAGEPGRAVEIARETHPGRVESVSRQTTFRLDTARALVHARRHSEAVRMLVAAEHAAPQRVRSSPVARETVRDLLETARRNAAGSALAGLCERLGVAV